MKIKRRSIIAGIITLGVLYLSFGLWSKQYELFIIISVLSYLLAYKLVDYLADFKTIKDKSRIDIIFLTVFFILLFVPTLKINNAEISAQENRTLATWKPLIKKHQKINYNFGKDFDDWYSDRFYGRAFFMEVYDKFQYKISHYYYKKGVFVLNKKNNWIGRPTIVAQKKTFTNNDIHNATKNINKINEYCKKNNIKLYILIAPLKEEIYSKEIFGTEFNLYDKTTKMKNYLEKHTGVPIILAYNNIKNASKSRYTYFKTDHHWTDEGAYLGYLKLMEQIQKDYPKIYISERKDFNFYNKNRVRVVPNVFQEGNSYQRMGLKDPKIFDSEYTFFKHKNYDKLKVKTENIKNGGIIFQYSYDINAPKIYIFGDSFTLNLLQFIPMSFNNTKNVYIPAQYEHSNIGLYEEDILSSHSNILVLCFSNIGRLTNIYKD